MRGKPTPTQQEIIDGLTAEVERLKAELEIAQKFHDVAVKERDLARHQLNAAEARAVKAEAERDELLAGCANAGWHIESGNPVGFIRKLKRALALHRCVTWDDGSVWCSLCSGESWPCPTVEALTGGRKK